ncbi:ABC transporter permease [Leptospira levettii]|uniref:ABC transporter permease n=1 Tax=Leptospira levettii TaxID=2023178 RepID=UPI001082DAC7|nr:ABC transporter permease [Leptospira levettii]MCW7506577.1 ABC transporter permease [Leptospira levettii]MCW7517667.1 ABC transporter permease [Leptospira levettii]TGK93210.1 ABC transporter permease [Leptospira levettii]
MTNVMDRFITFLFYRKSLALFLLLSPLLVWLGVVYLGSLFTLLIQSFFSVDSFSGVIKREFTFESYYDLFRQSTNWDIIIRTTTMAFTVTVVSAIIAFPIAYYMAMNAGPKLKPILYLGVMLPLWSSYLVKVYSWKLIMAKEGILTWCLDQLGLLHLLDVVLSIPVIGGSSLSFSYIGMFLVFVYIWLPYMILPIQASLERIPKTLLEASSDLGGGPAQTFRKVILPLAFPGVVAGSIFTFSLTLGDYIIPTIIGNSSYFIGMAVYTHQGTAGNIPLAAAFSVVPIVIMMVYLTIAKRLGAFDAL